MRYGLIWAVSALSIQVFAQPVIQNGNNIPSVGFSAPVSVIVSSSTDITAGGSNHTWDFSAYTFSQVGTLNVIAPSSTPMGSSFPTANYAFSFGGTYSFFNVGATKMEALAWTITQAGVGNDYTPNPKTLLKFPFNFNDTESDTWQKVGGAANSVTLYYDSYGTLITPSGTYTDVVRIRENYGPGEDDYQWYILNSLIPVAIFDHNSTTLYHIAATQVSGIDDHKELSHSFKIYPNPAQGFATVGDISRGSVVRLLDVTGKVVFSASSSEDTFHLKTDTLEDGLYLVQVEENGSVAHQKLLIN